MNKLTNWWMEKYWMAEWMDELGLNWKMVKKLFDEGWMD